MNARAADYERRGKTDILSVRVPPEMAADLRALAEDRQSSMGSLVREACAKLLRHTAAVKKAKTVDLPPPDPDHVHPVDSSVPYERAQQILARHLCGWIAGHHAPPEHFLVDADMILGEMHAAGVRFHLRGATENPSDGFVGVHIDGGLGS